MVKLPAVLAVLTPDERIERWTKWLKETEKEAFHLYGSRYAFENIQQMFVSNEALKSSGSHIYEWMHRNFYTEHLMAIRKEMETGGGYFTLMNFLIELEQHSEEVLTRKRYVALYADSVLKEHGIPDKHFDAKKGATCRYPKEPDVDFISSDSVRRTRKRLERANEKVIDFANCFVAHRTNAEPIDLTLSDVYRAVNRIFDTYAVYHNIITAAIWAGKFPTPQYDWHKPFSFPWVTKDFKAFEPPE